MAAVSQATRNTITLKGSTQIVTEFFGYGINSILYQRGIYPPESFVRVSKYGLSMMVTTNEGLKTYLAEVLSQMQGWLLEHLVEKLVLVVKSVGGETLERWTFNIECNTSVRGDTAVDAKPEKEIQSEIQAIIRQITASVTYLPMLDDACTFDLLIYTNSDVSVPTAWEESNPCYIANSQEVRLRSFSTSVHKIDGMVAFKA
eukprot:Amastigsp_a678598_55.p1 type:complete len:202 gc:universal Amastigsp_a678598_55:27-632(+)